MIFVSRAVNFKKCNLIDPGYPLTAVVTNAIKLKLLCLLLFLLLPPPSLHPSSPPSLSYTLNPSRLLPHPSLLPPTSSSPPLLLLYP